MSRHRYAVGSIVDFTPRKGSGPIAAGAYKVVQLVPTDGASLQYRIKSDLESFQRVALEQNLSPR